VLNGEGYLYRDAYLKKPHTSRERVLEEECYIKVAILGRARLRLYLYFLQASQLRESVTIQSLYSKDSFMKLTALWSRLVLGPGLRFRLALFRQC